MDVSTNLYLKNKLGQLNTQTTSVAVQRSESSIKEMIGSDYMGSLFGIKLFEGHHDKLLKDTTLEIVRQRARNCHAGCLVFCSVDKVIARRTSVEVDELHVDQDPQLYWDFYCAPETVMEPEWIDW